ncbi:MAG: SH3 domain-containing protein, partial [Sarcina sp.]
SIQDKLAPNTKVRVNSKTSTGWYNITYSGKTGYVSADYIKFVESGNTGGGQTNTTPVNKDGVVANLGSVSALNVRTGPGTTNSIQDKLSLNTKVRVNYKTQNGWYNISYSGKSGFVSADYIRLVENNDGGTGTESGNINKNGTVINVSTSLNVRTGPSTSYSIKDKIAAGKVVKVNYEKNGWYNISYDGKIGYVSKDYIKLSSGSNGGTTTPETTAQKGKIINVSSNLNVRSGRGTNYSIIGYVLGDEIVTVLDHKEGWHKIEYTTSNGKKTGYVKDDFVKIL